MISAGLASVLRSDRAGFNARFATARRARPELDPAAFKVFLETSVDELARAVEQVRSDRLGEVVQVSYDAGLELVGQGLAGPHARTPAVENAWRRVLPGAAALVAQAPGRIIPALCNAAYQLAVTPGARVQEWTEGMAALSSRCPDPAAWGRLGQVIAWRAGLAHLREGALAVADGLPEPLALAALRARPGIPWASLREELRANPWSNPSADDAADRGNQVVAEAGAFIGFGGLFPEPPLVVCARDQFLVRCDQDGWWLMADAFGATFHRATAPELEALTVDRKGSPDGAGRARLPLAGSSVELEGRRLDFPALGVLRSAAANSTTLALTSRFSHAVFLVALHQ